MVKEHNLDNVSVIDFDNLTMTVIWTLTGTTHENYNDPYEDIWKRTKRYGILIYEHSL